MLKRLPDQPNRKPPWCAASRVAVAGFTAVLGLASATVASAASYTDVVNFGAQGVAGAVADDSFYTVTGTFAYDHLSVFEYATIDSGSLTIEARNPGLKNEIWVVSANGETLLGEFGTSDEWTLYSFTVAAGVLEDLAAGGGLRVDITDTVATGSDNIQLRWSALSGDYTPVPLPAAGVLLASGLAGLAGWRRRVRERR